MESLYTSYRCLTHFRAQPHYAPMCVLACVARVGVDELGGGGVSPGSLRERAIPPNSRPRTSLELRMAAAEALHMARRASPAPENLYGVSVLVYRASAQVGYKGVAKGLAA